MTGLAGDIIVGEEQDQRNALPAPCDAPLFHHSLLCQLGLPRRHMEERVFERRSGAASLLMTAGHWYVGDSWVPQPLPYGSRPRLIFVNVVTEAVRTRSRTVEIERSVRGFLRRLGIDCGGNSMMGFKRQMIALSCCHMQLGFRTELGVGQVDAKPISRFEAWRAVKDGKLWPGELDLSMEFYESAIEHAVPLDPLALAGLQNSAMALDVYSWLAHRLCRVTQPSGTIVSWRALKEQFGQEYAVIDEFRRAFIEAMGKAFLVYRDARVEIVRGGLRLLPSPPPIRKSMVVTPLLEKKTSADVSPPPKGDALTRTAAPPAPQTKTPDHPMPPLEPRTMERILMLCPGWTIEELWARSPHRGVNQAWGNFDERFKNWAVEFIKHKDAVPTGAAEARPAPPDSPSQLKPETLAAVRDVAPGYSPAWLEEKFFEWNRSKGTSLRNPDKAFLRWAETFTKGKRP